MYPTTLHQIILLGLAVAWLLLLGLALRRYQRLPQGHFLVLATLLWPTLLIDECLKAFTNLQSLAFLTGAFQFVVVLITTLVFFSVRNLLVEMPLKSKTFYFVPTLLIVVLQLPLMILPVEYKMQLLAASPIGNLLGNWPIYLSSLLIGLVVMTQAIWIEELIMDYQHHLSEQVVDIHLYKLPAAVGLFAGLITLSFIAIVLTVAAAFAWLHLSQWQSITQLSYATLLLGLLTVLSIRLRYSPSPIHYHLLESNQYSSAQLQQALDQAEQAMIRTKAYKKVGLRLRPFADAAGVQPQLLIAATRTLLNRDFRAFVFHYRLEYAKKVLMRSDSKVTNVAKKLGFESEKFLSRAFVKYVDEKGNGKSL